MKEKRFCHHCGRRLVARIIDGSDRLYCAHCRQVLYENPIPATCIVVDDNGGGVLLVKRSVEPKIGFWCLPGGFMELGETPEESALRELEEETGLKGQIDRLLGVTTNPSDRYDTVLMIGFLVKTFTGALFPGDDASAAAFFTENALPEIAFESHETFIRKHYAAKRG